ncbi:MAG: helix-turn-helix domain-containing protein [Syntrophobacteraceae bacterium]|jgi:predicted DNA-binding transcriptional regulator AlpA
MPLLLTTKQASELLSISPSWLEHARLRGEGPQHVKVGGKVLYRPTALEAWVSRLEEDQAPVPHRGRKRKHLVCL